MAGAKLPEHGVGISNISSWDDFGNLEEFFVSPEEQRDGNISYQADPSRVAQESTLPADIVELLAFWVADEEYSVDILDIQEIIPMREITEVPRANPCLLGIISLRGTVVPILDLRDVLELPKSEVTRNTRVLVLQGDAEPVGIMVDNVTSVVRLSQREIEPKPKAMQREIGDVIEGVGRLEQRVLIVLDASAVIEVLERKS